MTGNHRHSLKNKTEVFFNIHKANAIYNNNNISWNLLTKTKHPRRTSVRGLSSIIECFVNMQNTKSVVCEKACDLYH